MTRLRVTFLALALLLLLPLGLLVGRALVSLANERELRHQIVAERIFDEMERELTALGAESRSDRASKISQSVARNVMPYSRGGGARALSSRARDK